MPSVYTTEVDIVVFFHVFGPFTTNHILHLTANHIQSMVNLRKLYYNSYCNAYKEIKDIL